MQLESLKCQIQQEQKPTGELLSRSDDEILAKNIQLERRLEVLDAKLIAVTREKDSVSKQLKEIRLTREKETVAFTEAETALESERKKNRDHCVVLAKLRGQLEKVTSEVANEKGKENVLKRLRTQLREAVP